MATKTYQDAWLKGKAIRRGNRECAERYSIVRTFCQRYTGPFAVCDIGSNMNYFGLRLTEDFPLCDVVAFEFDHFALRQALLDENGARRVALIRERLRVEQVEIIGAHFRFDLVLALSVLHHQSASFDRWLRALRNLGKDVVIELAMRDSARVKNSTYPLPSEALRLGDASSHLDSQIRRPIIYVPGVEHARE